MISHLEAVWNTTVTTAVGGLCLHLWTAAQRQLLRRVPDEELQREFARRERLQARLNAGRAAFVRRARGQRRAA